MLPTEECQNVSNKKKSNEKMTSLRVRGTLKAATLHGDQSIPGLVCVSVYDSKPVYVMSNACTKIEWTE